MNNIDQRIIRAFTTAYLWLLDWTGVYIGSLIIFAPLLYCFWNIVVLDRSAFVLLFIGVPLFLSGLSSWVLQHTGMLAAMNASAMRWAEGRLRKFVVLFWCFAFVVDITAFGWRHAVPCLFMIAWLYLECVLVRDREPREWKISPKLQEQAQ